MKKNRNSMATDSFILIFVQVITMSVGIVNAMILSRTLSKYDYGTYSQGLLIISVVMPFVALGMNQGINYFFNKSDNKEEKENYINTIFTLTVIAGITSGIGILLFNVPIENYFGNIALSGLMGYIAFRPLLSNLIALYQPLYISNGMAKAIAVRNLIISIAQVSIIAGVSIFTQDITLIFLFLLILDLAQLVILGVYIRKCGLKVRFFSIKIEVIKPIFSYCVPMALATLVGTLALNMDKLLISAVMTTEDLAVYSNASKELPLGFIVSSFTMVVLPVIIKLTNTGEKKKLAKVWADYIEIGYITTWILGAATLVCSNEIFDFLYTNKYSDGIAVFIVYLLISMSRFSYFGIILSSSGKTKWILFYVSLTLILNLVLNLFFYQWWGMVGPAIASLVSIGFVAILQFYHSTRIVKLKILEVFRIKDMLILLLELSLIGGVVVILKDNVLSLLPLNNFINLLIFFGFFVGAMVFLQHKKIKQLIYDLNHEH